MTREAAIQKWLEGVHNVAISFRPVIYQTNAVPTKADMMSALSKLSRLSEFDGFIDDSIEEMYAQQVYYALEHMHSRVWNDSQLVGACVAITSTLGAYLHYDPTIGNGIAYQTKCFHKTLREVDKAYHKYSVKRLNTDTPVQIRKKAIPCCLTPYYKYNVIKNPSAQLTFKYKAEANKDN